MKRSELLEFMRRKAQIKQIYFARFPEGPIRESWEGITYFRAKPTWIRFSDFTQDPPVIMEFAAADLADLK